MRTIGLIGGMSWESSALYYRLINEETKRRLGGHHNAPSLMVTVDFADVECLQHQREWKQLASLLVNAAQSLERGGVDFIVLCTNTMHKLADAITAAVEIPSCTSWMPQLPLSINPIRDARWSSCYQVYDGASLLRRTHARQVWNRSDRTITALPSTRARCDLSRALSRLDSRRVPREVSGDHSRTSAATAHRYILFQLLIAWLAWNSEMQSNLALQRPWSDEMCARKAGKKVIEGDFVR